MDNDSTCRSLFTFSSFIPVNNNSASYLRISKQLSLIIHIPYSGASCLPDIFWDVSMDASMYDDPPDPSQTRRDNALHLTGTAEMSTSDIHSYISRYTDHSKPRIEWIDDNSLNLVYYSTNDAAVALAHLTGTATDEIGHRDSVAAHPRTEAAGDEKGMGIRWANESDKKIRGAKDRSRWYLFHPEDDPDLKPRIHRRRSRSPRARHDSKDGYDRHRSRSPRLERREGKDLFEHKSAQMSGEDKFSLRIAEASERKLSDRIAPRELFEDKMVKEDLFSEKLKDRIGPLRIRGTARRKAADLF